MDDCCKRTPTVSHLRHNWVSFSILNTNTAGWMGGISFCNTVCECLNKIQHSIVENWLLYIPLTHWCTHRDFHGQFYNSECHNVPKHYNHEEGKNFSLNCILIFHWMQISLSLLRATFYVWDALLPWQVPRHVFLHTQIKNLCMFCRAIVFQCFFTSLEHRVCGNFDGL